MTRRAHQSGYSRTAVYMHAQRVVQAVASEQAGGISYDALWQENERLKAENDALWQAWSEAEDLSEAKQRDFAGSGCAMGLSLSQIVTLLAIVLPRGAGAQSGHGRSLGAGGGGASGSSSGGARSGLSGASAGALSRRNLPASRACVDGDRTATAWRGWRANGVRIAAGRVGAR